ncbi:hypothetical protein [Lactobacillus intestinalis]|nr:hypothetical protein [Lactobacillus intestinalis]
MNNNNAVSQKLINKLAVSEYNNAVLEAKVDELTQELKAEKENKDVKNK